MQATYTHRGKGSADYARKTWMPEPVEAPKAYKIFDIEVSKDVYDRYNKRYDFADRAQAKLWEIDMYTTGKELPEHYPERAAAARKIKAQIIAEITGKDVKSMSAPKKSVEFIAALEELYGNSRAEYTTEEKKLATAKANAERCENAKKKKPGDPIVCAKYDVARGEYLIAQDEFRKAIVNLQGKHNAAVKDLRGKFSAFLDDRYAANPDALDTGTITLLNSGICSPAELLKLAERHANNPTMLRLVSTQAKKIYNPKTMSQEESISCSAVRQMASVAENGGRELAIFDSAVGAAERGLQTDALAAARMHNHITGWFGDFKAQIENLPLTPAGNE